MRVVFVQKFVPHYRLPFFEQVRTLLAQHHIEFVLLYAKADPYEASKVSMVEPDWATSLPTRHLSIAGRYLYWTGVLKYLKKGDFVIVEHAAKLLDNYVIFAARQCRYVKMGYFGHGENFQATTEYRVSAVLKRIMLRVDRWFAYTEVSRQSLLRQGVSEASITVVNNTLQPSEHRHLAQQTPKSGACVYIGGLYSLKLLPLLINACDQVAQTLDDFELHMVGDGPDKPFLEDAAQTRPWLNIHGSLYGAERDAVLAQSCAILMPGLVGLIAIDAFQFERPIITSEAGEHSPEIAYLVHGENCLIDSGVDGNVSADSYAAAVLRYLTDTALQQRLRAGCRASNQVYSIENMAHNFCEAFLSSES